MSIELINTTGYAVFGFRHVLFQERPYYIVITKQSWQLMPGGGMRPLDKPRPARVGDRFQGRPIFSAIDLPTDLIPFKPHGEIVICGHARSAVPRPHWDVEVALGDWSKSLRVFGPRNWRQGVLGWSVSDPALTQLARLDYAAAYGGHVELPPAEAGKDPLVIAHGPNPGGTGWLGKGHGQALNKQQKHALKGFAQTKEVVAPAIEPVAWLSQHRPPGQDVKPQSFGAMPAWSERRMAYLRGTQPPKPDQTGYGDDFNMNHWQQAASDQWLPRAALPGAALHLRGVFEEGDAVYRIPRPQTLSYVRSRQALNAVLESDIDTLVLDADERVLEVIERRLVSLQTYGEDAVIEVLQRAN
jgi:hypothetical protein